MAMLREECLSADMTTANMIEAVWTGAATEPEETTRTSARTSSLSPRVEVMVSREPRRRWTIEQKLAIVAESCRPGAAPMAIARKHGLSSGQMSTWRRQFARAAAQTPVLTRAEAVCAQSPETASRISGLIEILLPNGVIVRTDGGVSEKFLRRVLAAARG